MRRKVARRPPADVRASSAARAYNRRVRPHLRALSLIAFGWWAGACGRPPLVPGGGEWAGRAVAFAFSPDLPVGQEAYICFGFDGAPAAGEAIFAIDWTAPTGAVVLHHAKLYAVPGEYPDGPLACDGMPSGSLPLHVWLPGGGPLRLPSGVGVAVPAATRRFVVEAHVLRLHDGPAGQARAVISFAGTPPAREAAWTALAAPVPPLRPMHLETSSARCAIASAMHLYYAWPHMHLLGKSFESVIYRAGGSTEPLLDVPVWDFNHQIGQAVDIDIEAGDALGITCTWWNGTDAYVLPGPRTTDEMCQAGFIAWPAVGALCPAI